MSVCDFREVSAWYMGVKSAMYTFTASPYWARASDSLAPMVAMGGCVNTTVGIISYCRWRSGFPPNTRSLKRRPAAIATGRQRGAPGDVADRINLRDIRILITVGGDEIGIIERNTRLRNVEPIDVGLPADRPQNAVEVRKLASIDGSQGFPTRHRADTRQHHLLLYDRAVSAYFALQGVTQHRVEVREHMFFADEQFDFAAEFVERARKFAGDIAAADDCHTCRSGFEFEESVGRDAQFRTRQRGHDGPAPRRYDDVPGAETVAAHTPRCVRR